MCVQLFCIGMSRFRQLFGSENKVNLKSDLKQLIFPGNANDPVAMCEDAGKFTMAMSVFQNYERTVRICMYTCMYMYMYTYDSTVCSQMCALASYPGPSHVGEGPVHTVYACV